MKHRHRSFSAPGINCDHRDVYCGHSLMRTWLVLMLLLPAPLAWSDMVVREVRGGLSYQYSPGNPINSPYEERNSIRNPHNSPARPENQSSFSDNRPDNPLNGPNGDRRLLLPKGAANQYVGYHYQQEKGRSPVNIFSPTGERLFYKPRRRQAVFHGTRGFFCGVIRTSPDGRLVLYLTRRGMQVLEGGELSSSRRRTRDSRTKTKEPYIKDPYKLPGS